MSTKGQHGMGYGAHDNVHANSGKNEGPMHFGTPSDGGAHAGVPVPAKEVREPSGLDHMLGSEPVHG